MAEGFGFRNCPCPPNYPCRCPPRYHPAPNYPSRYPDYPPNDYPSAPSNYPSSPNFPPHYSPPSSSPYNPSGRSLPKERAYYWVDTYARGGGVPSTALPGGVDIDGEQIYVGRAFFAGDWLPAKVIPGRNEAYVAFDGREHKVEQFQVLCEQRFDWVPCQGGQIPPDAVEGGRTSDGEPLYIGRAHHQGSYTIGKVHPSHGTCYIPFGGDEISYKNFEILVLRV